MPGGGGACLAAASAATAALPESRSFAGGGGGVCFGDVPVLGMMTWMPMLLALISFHDALRPDASG